MKMFLYQKPSTPAKTTWWLAMIAMSSHHHPNFLHEICGFYRKYLFIIPVIPAQDLNPMRTILPGTFNLAYIVEKKNRRNRHDWCNHIDS